MPIFAPFGYIKNPDIEPTPPWAPSDFTNVQYWWRADLGVTTTGTDVTNWVDQINGLDITQTNAANRPTLTTSANLNGQATINFNGTTDWLSSKTTPAAVNNTDVTTLSIYRIPNTPPGAGIIFGYSGIFAAAGRMFIDGVSGNLRLYSQWAASKASVLQSPMTSGNKSFYWNYDSSAGNEDYAYNTLTTTNLVTGGLTGRTNNQALTVAVGATINSVNNQTVFSGRYIEVVSAENVVIYGTPTTQELNDWKSYVNTRYGTIIS